MKWWRRGATRRVVELRRTELREELVHVAGELVEGVGPRCRGEAAPLPAQVHEERVEALGGERLGGVRPQPRLAAAARRVQDEHHAGAVGEAVAAVICIYCQRGAKMDEASSVMRAQTQQQSLSRLLADIAPLVLLPLPAGPCSSQ